MGYNGLIKRVGLKDVWRKQYGYGSCEVWGGLLAPRLPFNLANECLRVSGKKREKAMDACFFCKKRWLRANKVSHSNIHTPRRQKPNTQKVKAKIDGRSMRIRVCTRCIRSGRVSK